MRRHPQQPSNRGLFPPPETTLQARGSPLLPSVEDLGEFLDRLDSSLWPEDSADPNKELAEHPELLAEVLDGQRQRRSLLSAIGQGEPMVTSTFTCELHGPFERKGVRWGIWRVWRGYEEIYSGGWSGDAGCAGCRSEREERLQKFELETPAHCNVHGEIVVKADLVVSTTISNHISVSTELCLACAVSWGEQVYLQDQLNLSREQWDLPGVGDQILAALHRAEEAGSASG
jgi:hypothetical protein